MPTYPSPFLLIKSLFDADLCARLCGQMYQARRESPPVMKASKMGVDGEVDLKMRDTQVAFVDRETAKLAKDRFMALAPRAAKFLNVTIHACQDPQFLIYGPGGHYKPHLDNSGKPGSPDYVLRRRGSIIVPLNPRSAEPMPGCYTGGALAVYIQPPDRPENQKVRIEVPADAGDAIVFAHDLLHGVEPVTDGIRYSLVGWYE